MSKAHYNFSFKRRCLIDDGQQMFCGARSSSQSSVSVLEGTGTNSEHRHHSIAWKTLSRASVERHLQKVTEWAMHCARCLDPLVCSHLPGSIATMGHAPLAHSLLVIAPQLVIVTVINHADAQDKIDNALAKSILEQLENYSFTQEFLKSHVFEFNQLFGLGVPTVCAYQALIKCNFIRQSDVFIIFIYKGLGCMHRICDGDAQVFCAHAFHHNRAMPFIIKNDNVFYNDDYLQQSCQAQMTAQGKGRSNKRQ